MFLITLQDEKEKQTTASRGRTLLQYARKHGKDRHVSYVLDCLKKCGIDIDIEDNVDQEGSNCLEEEHNLVIGSGEESDEY